MVTFKERYFGVASDTLKGATVGFTLGGLIGRFGLDDSASKTVKIKSREITIDKAHIGAFGGALVGAALGFFASAIRTAANAMNRRATVNNRLMPEVVKLLEKMGHKEGMSFTRDPGRADLMKSKVSIVVYKYSDDLRVVVNTVNDDKLAKISKEVSNQVAKSKSSVYREEVSGKFKNIKITAMSDASEDAGYIAWIASTYINNGYPVYLVEVG